MRIKPVASLYDACGNRKYLTQEERSRFLDRAKKARPEIMTFCMVLEYTGARISEVLSLCPEQLDFQAQCIAIRSIKKRTDDIYRAVPVPLELLEHLDAAFALQEKKSEVGKRLWPWSRTTAWSYVSALMLKADVQGKWATPKGLRHAFGVSAIQSGVSLNMVQKWMGHADLATTAIYTNAIGQEELQIAHKLWRSFS